MIDRNTISRVANDLNSPWQLRSLAKRSVHVNGRYLRALRNSVGLTQESAAQKSGYSARLIRKLENGGPVGRRTLNDVVTCYRELSSDSDFPQSVDLVEDRTGIPSEVERRTLDWIEKVYFSDDATDWLFDLSKDAQWETPKRILEGPQQIQAHVARFHKRLSVKALQIDHCVCSDDSGTVHWTIRLSQREHAAGIEGQEIIMGCTLLVYRNGRVTRIREHSSM